MTFTDQQKTQNDNQMRSYMRFVWLAATIAFAILAVYYFDMYYFKDEGEDAENIGKLGKIVYPIIAVAIFTILVCFTVSGYAKEKAREMRAKNLSLKAERDEDIKKWRKEFYGDTINVYDTQEETLKRAKKIRSGESDEPRFVHKKCQNCGAKNRIREDNQKSAVCGNCNSPLSEQTGT